MVYTTCMIRHLTSADAALYRDLRLLALTTDPDAYFSTYSEMVHKPIGHFQTEISGIAPWGYYGWFDEHTLVGYISIDRSSYEKKKHIASFYNLSVHPEHRRTGVGRNLVRHAIAQVEPLSEIQSIELTVIEGNDKALSLYESLGFERYGRRPESVQAEQRLLAELFMMKKLR